MVRQPGSFLLTRREMLRGGLACTGAALLAPLVPDWIAGPLAARQPAAGADPLAQMRAQMGALPIQTTKLGDRLTMLSGPGGNVVVLTGSDGKIVVDTFVQPAWEPLNKTMAELGKEPIKALIDTHWHFDHTDNNAEFKKAGAAIIAHENTKTRMSETHQLLGMKFPASPPEALPTQTFKTTHNIDANGEQIVLAYIPPAHTDTDITIRFAKANAIHLGDLFFNGLYPFIDASTGGKINGMIAAADSILKAVDANTKIVPGHGPLGDQAALTKFRDMMVTIRDRVQKLKTAGQTLDEVIAANPSKEFDETWGKGFMDPKSFIAIVYGTL
jgi:cyclase